MVAFHRFRGPVCHSQRGRSTPAEGDERRGGHRRKRRDGTEPTAGVPGRRPVDRVVPGTGGRRRPRARRAVRPGRIGRRLVGLRWGRRSVGIRPRCCRRAGPFGRWRRGFVPRCGRRRGGRRHLGRFRGGRSELLAGLGRVGAVAYPEVVRLAAVGDRLAVGGDARRPPRYLIPAGFVGVVDAVGDGDQFVAVVEVRRGPKVVLAVVLRLEAVIAGGKDLTLSVSSSSVS